MKTRLLDAALEYTSRGLSIIPIKPDKKPFIRWEEFQKRKATENEVKAWLERWPSAMIGLVTGSISGLVVVDIDEPKGHEEIQKYIPDSLIIPTCQTPSGGQHLYFKVPDKPLGNNTRVIPGCDFRGEGGYVVAPPSVNGNGKVYTWMPRLSLNDIPLPALPTPYINKIINSNGDMRSSEETDHIRQRLTTFDNIFSIQGRRDEDLFHVANSLTKGGMSGNDINQVLKILARSCNPPFPEEEISAKIESAMKRAEARERNLTREIREWVLTTTGNFLTTDVYIGQHLTTREEKKKAVVILSRLVEEGIIQRTGTKNGCFRRVENQAEPVDFLSAPTGEFPIIWPLGVHQLSILYPGNITVVAGSKGAGKTAFLLNTVRLNQDQHEIIYLNSEMGDTEFRKRLELFEGIPLSSWKVKAYHRNSNFEDLITRGKKIFIVDFLEVTTDFWKIAQYIQEIHKKLKEGLAIIALQKSENREHGRGGDFSKEKARLYLTLDYLPDQKLNRMKIIDAKAWRGDRNPRGMFRDYKLIQGSKFVEKSEWEE